MCYKTSWFLVRGVVVIISLQFLLSSALAEGACDEAAGKLVSIQGEAQVLRNKKSAWNPVQLHEEFCAGDMLRVGIGGRAAVALDNETVLRIDQKSTITFGKAAEDHYSILKLLKGVLHIFSHRPRSLKVVTPYVNGAVEGTEFLVTVGPDESVITVFEGKVTAVNKQGQLDLISGQSAFAQKGTAPKYMTVVKPRDATHWTLYYPYLIDRAAPDHPEQIVTIADQLTVGRVEEARKQLSRILAKDSNNSEALALLSITEIVQNNKQKGLSLAQKAVGLDTHSAAARLALSYAQQAHFDIEGALATLEEAASFNPGDVEVKARLAELLLSVGALDRALETAQEAVNLNPAIGRTQTVLGFAHLTRIETAQAITAFNEAISLDSALPLARLGLGLANIRNGDLGVGRAEIEIAAALDPSDALIRSYLGKAYFEEKRDSQSRRQYDIAKELDPSDPTPWFYDAIRKQTENQPVEALHDIQQSIALNDNRAVYRSRLLLDSDLAARSASLGRIYNDLGFERLALVEGWKSVNTDPGNYSAHRFLADSYSAVPRHQVSRLSELLQSQLLQPLNLTPVQPHLAEAGLNILEGSGSSNASFNEYNPLFLRNRLALQVSGVVGSNNILGDELVHSAVWNNLSYSLGQYYYRTDGIRANNDYEHKLYNAFVQGMLSPSTSLMTEFRFGEEDFGDLRISSFEEDFTSETIRHEQEDKSFRVGARHDFQPNSTLIGTISFDSGDIDVSEAGFFPLFDLGSYLDSYLVELQHLYRGNRFRVQSGAGYASGDSTESIYLYPPFDFGTESEIDKQHANAYALAQIDVGSNILATVGLSGDLVESDLEGEDKSELNPKLGVTWQPMESTIVRGAIFKTLQRSLTDQTIEPTQIAGFSQFVRVMQGATEWFYGIGIDHKFSGSWFGGLEFVHKDQEVPYIGYDLSGIPQSIEDDWQEDVGSAYLYWAPVNWASLGIEYYYEKYEHDEFYGGEEISNLRTHRITPRINFFHRSGVIAKLQAHYVDQQGDFVGDYSNSGPIFESRSADFWIVDLAVSYRLPKRYGIVKIEARNLFDEEFQFIDTDIYNPRFMQEQQIIFSFTLAF